MGHLTDIFKSEEKLIEPHDLAAHKAQSISDLGSGSADLGQATISASVDAMRTQYRVDYSDFSNFVFFNSALDYFNICGEKIINEYPHDGSYLDYWNFISSSDGYQRYLFQVWPRYAGVLAPNSSSIVTVQNVGNVGDYAKTNFFSPSTSSFTAEFWFTPVTSTVDCSPFFFSGTGNKYWRVNIVSGSTAVTVSFTATDGTVTTTLTGTLSHTASHTFVSVVCDQINLSSSMYFAEEYKVPVRVAVSGFSAATTMNVSPLTASLLMGSGTCGTTEFDEFRLWGYARAEKDIHADYKNRLWAQADLLGYWKFDESPSGSTPNSVWDYSGHKASGTINNTTALRSGSLYESIYSEPIRDIRDPAIDPFVTSSFVSSTQLTAWLYDKNNTNLIHRMVPGAYFELEQEIGTEVLQNFLYIIARQFDELKVATDQFIYWNKSNYTGFNDTPDALLKDAANFYGWDFVGNFLSKDALKYFFGRNVVPGIDLQTKLYQIKNEFWRRTLNELMHIYKTKGTRESVEALIRVYGMDSKLVKLKEYGVQPESSIKTIRINSHRSLPAYRVRDGISDYIASDSMFGCEDFTLALHARFLTSSTPATGTIAEVGPFKLKYWTDNSNFATMQFVSESTPLAAVSSTFVGSGWWNIFAATDSANGYTSLRIQKLEEDVVVSASVQSSSVFFLPMYAVSFSATIGHSQQTQGEFFVHEVKLYNTSSYGRKMTQAEMDAQTLDFQSYGLNNVNDLSASLAMHWRLDDDFTIPAGVNFNQFAVYDFSGHEIFGTLASNTTSSDYRPFRDNHGKRFMFDYNFIAPVEYGWNENKIRIYPSSSVPYDDRFNEANALAIEFNLIDALNEDISKALVTMENWNNIIGLPANRFRDTYHDLEKYRTYYFDKLIGRINFREFADMLEFFDRSFIKMIQKLLPARAIFYGEEFVIESHMLERPKVQWVYRRYNPELVPEGIILMTDNQWVAQSSSYAYPTGSKDYR